MSCRKPAEIVGIVLSTWCRGNQPKPLLLAGMSALELVDHWPVTTVAAGWLRADGRSETAGDVSRVFPLASITKALFAYAVLVAVEEGSLSLDQPAGPEGSTVAHLLSHSSGLAPEADTSVGSSFAAVGSRRIYSNQGFEVLASTLEASTGIDAATYLRLAVCEPLGMAATELRGSAAHSAVSTVGDLLAFCQELFEPQLIHRSTLAQATTPFLGDLSGVLPGFGRQERNTWGLGFEIRGLKEPHWTGRNNAATTYGHFGASGTFLWHDPDHGLACVALTDRQFGPWAAEVWPELSDAVLREAAQQA